VSKSSSRLRRGLRAGEHGAYKQKLRAIDLFILKGRVGERRGKLTAVCSHIMEKAEGTEPDSSQGYTATGQEATGVCWNMGNSNF